MTPVFGEIADPESEFQVDLDQVVEFTLVGYDFVPNPVDGSRSPHRRTFHAVPEIPAEKIIGGFARSTGRGIDISSLSKMILSMLIPEEREAFLDFIEDPNLTFVPAMIEDTLEYLVEKATDDLPKEPSLPSSAGRKSRGGTTSKAGSTGRAGLPRGSSR
jgi:hypothetical protein